MARGRQLSAQGSSAWHEVRRGSTGRQDCQQQSFTSRPCCYEYGIATREVILPLCPCRLDHRWSMGLRSGLLTLRSHRGPVTERTRVPAWLQVTFSDESHAGLGMFALWRRFCEDVIIVFKHFRVSLHIWRAVMLKRNQTFWVASGPEQGPVGGSRCCGGRVWGEIRNTIMATCPAGYRWLGCVGGRLRTSS